jgi:hypothetical protein
MSETNKKESKQSAQEDRAEQSAPEKSATAAKNKPLWRYIDTSSLYGFGRSALGNPVFALASPVFVFPAIGAEGEALAIEEVTQEELQAACIRLSEYISNNISDIIKLREENDLLSGELRTAMAKLRAA